MIVESLEDVIVLSGALRANFWETVQTAIALTLKRHPTGVIIDCSGITEISEEGAKTFQDTIGYVLEHDRARIIFAAVPPNVMEILRNVPEVRSQLAVTKSVEEARASLDLLVGDSEGLKKRREGPKSFNRHILAVLSPNAFDQHVVEVTRELLSDNYCKVVMLIPIVVPRELPLQAPMVEAESKAKEFVVAAIDAFKEDGVPHEVRLERTRDIPSLVQEVAQEIDAAHVVVGLAADHGQDEATSKIFYTLLERVNRSLIFVRAACKESSEIGAGLS
ncbi:hypothetical protein QPK87_14210 [Kamptonema cortianum]|nr:hypothetical protein [Geitlerinema splendidum]MDK3157721.1 hypothetical protein [Kamptonema cortianum]